MDPQSLVSRGPIPEIWSSQIRGDHLGRNPALPEMGSRDGSAEESSVTGQSGGGRNRRRRRDPGVAAVSEDESSKIASTSGGNDLTDYDVKHHQLDESRDENGDSKPETEGNSGNYSKPTDQSTQPSEAPKQDYIHVRARRGQATDSHSLAERARREKISERMKTLQDLVPGCNKIIGKALVLDEIINYIQSLQRQVEFLSMKLEAVNSRVNPGIDGLASKDFGIQAFESSSGMGFAPNPAREYGQGSPPQWLHMQVGGGFERGS